MGPIWQGLISPETTLSARDNHIAEYVIDCMEKIPTALKHGASRCIAGEKFRKLGAIVINRMDVGSRKLDTTIHHPAISLTRHRGVGLRLVNNADGIVVEQPRGIAIGIPRENLAGCWIDLTNRGKSFELAVSERGVSALTINLLTGTISRACFRDQCRGLTNGATGIGLCQRSGD